MKIAFIGQKGIPAQWGGVEKHVDELAHIYIEKNHEVLAYVRAHYTDMDMKDYDGIRLIHVPTIKGKHLDAGVHSLLSSMHVLFQDVDVINYQAIGPAFFSFIPKLFKPGVKIVVTNHGIDWQRKKWGVLGKTFLKLAEKVSVWTADELICVSPETVDYYKKNYGADAKYIPNGVRVQEIIHKDKIDKFGLTSGKYILFMARLVPEKGCHYLIEAFKQIDTDFNLVIAGDAAYDETYGEALHELAEDDPRIIFTGNITGTDWAEVFSNSYLFVQPSELDAAAFSILEAMSFKKAVLVSDIPDNIRLIKGHGISFQNKNTDDLRNKLEWLINNPDTVNEIGEKGYDYVVRTFNWNTIADKYLHNYLEIPGSGYGEVVKKAFSKVHDYAQRISGFMF